MDYTAAAIVLFMVMIAANMLWMARKIMLIEKMLQSIMDGGKFVMPKINDGMQMLQLAVRAGGAIAKRAADKRKAKKLKNLGGDPVIPDVDDGIMRAFVRALLREIEQKQQAGNSIADVALTEPVWVASGKFAEATGGSPQDFRACMDRLEVERVIKRGDGRGKRVWREPYQSITSKLKRFLS